MQFETNPVLFGHGTMPGLLAAELHNDRHMRLYRRDGHEDVAFSPYLWLTSADLLEGLKVPCRTEALEGSAAYRILAWFETWSDLATARKHVMKLAKGRAGADHLFLNDPVQQYLTGSGETLFKGLRYGDLKRLQLHLEIDCDGEFSHDTPHTAVLSLKSTGGWQRTLTSDHKDMIETLNRLIQQDNPDVIEGHDLFRQHLPYLLERARRQKLELAWGRDNSPATVRQTRINFAEKVVDYPRCDVDGRHLVDTWLLVQLYDISSRDMDGYTLADAGHYFGTLPDDSALDDDEAPLAAQCQEAVRQVDRIAELLSASYFLQSQMLPYNYQDVVVKGNATKINALFLREYLRRRHSIPPVPDDYNTYEGGYTQIFEEGVIPDIVHCDVASLYPSLMLVYKLSPRQDALGMFLPLLEDLRTFRLQAKRQAQQAETAEERHHFTALQQTFKIFINSFYGYLGTTFSNFADTQMAAEVTQKGRDLINQVIDELRRHGCRPIEIDTDGVYFVPPPGVDGATVVETISAVLPAGLKLETDATYPAMFSHKTKNYALLNHDGSVTIRGSGLKSRGLEKYLRDLTLDIIRHLLQGRSAELAIRYDEVMAQLAAHALPIRALSKTETLSETLASYQQKVQGKKRNAAAAYELALKSGRRHRPGDRITYYVAGSARKVRLFDQCKLTRTWRADDADENVAYYQQKAKETFERFLPYTPADSPLRSRLGATRAVQQQLL